MLKIQKRGVLPPSGPSKGGGGYWPPQAPQKKGRVLDPSGPSPKSAKAAQAFVPTCYLHSPSSQTPQEI